MATTTTTTTPTGWAADAAFSNWQRAQQIAQQPYQQYPGNMLAGWNQGQQQGYNSALNNANIGIPALQLGQQLATQAGAFQPSQVQGGGYQAALPSVMNTAAHSAGPAQQMGAAQMDRGDVRNVQAGNFTQANLNDYMNPYIGSVVNTTLGQLGRQNDVLQNQANAKAASAGAFGGSRQAIMNSENNRNFMDTAANTTANLYNTGFNTAQQAIATDQNRALQAGQLNQAADMTVGQANLANRQQAGMQNMLQGNEMARYNTTNAQQAENTTIAAHNATRLAQANALNQAGQFNAEQGLRAQLANQQAGLTASQNQLQAANALNGMGLDAQKYNLNDANAQFAMGQARTAYDQLGLDNAYNQWAQAQNYPMTQLGVLQSGLNGYSSGTQQTTPYYSNTGANILAGTLGAGALGAGILKNGTDIASGAKSIWNALPDIPGFGWGN